METACKHRGIEGACKKPRVKLEVTNSRVLPVNVHVQVIRNTQHGFRKGKSCLTNLLVFLDRVTRCIDEGGSMNVIFWI